MILYVMSNITKGMIAYYNFNNGNLNDSSGNGNNIVFNNATPTVDRFGNPNNAYLFDGSTNYMQVTNSASLNPNAMTIYAIVKPTGFFQGTCHGNQILSKGYPYDVNGFYALTFLPYDNGIGACAANPDQTKEIFEGSYGDDIPQGSDAGARGISLMDSVYIQKYEWYTVVFTYDGTTAKFYVDGALANSFTNTGTVTFTPNLNDLFIGKHENPQYPYYFNGTIDEIRLYNRAITDQEVDYLDILRSKYLRSKTTKEFLY
jgi:hypothetical protein